MRDASPSAPGFYPLVSFARGSPSLLYAICGKLFFWQHTHEHRELMHYAPHMWTSRPSPNLFVLYTPAWIQCPEATKYSNGGLESRPVFSLSLPSPRTRRNSPPSFCFGAISPLSPFNPRCSPNGRLYPLPKRPPKLPSYTPRFLLHAKGIWRLVIWANIYQSNCRAAAAGEGEKLILLPLVFVDSLEVPFVLLMPKNFSISARKKVQDRSLLLFTCGEADRS